MKFIKDFKGFNKVSEELKYHVENDIGLDDTVFRLGSDAHSKLFEEAKLVAKKIEWGDPGLSVKNDDPGAAASFWARHQCDQKKKMDPNKAGFWACYGPSLFGKQLGLKSTQPW